MYKILLVAVVFFSIGCNMESNDLPLAAAIENDIVLENENGGYDAIVKTSDEFDRLVPYVRYVDNLRLDCSVDLSQLEGLVNLQKIHFKKARLGAELKSLGALPNLARIDIRGELVDIHGWEAISKCSLRNVYIYGDCTDADLASFSQMDSLEKLYMESKSVTMEGVRQLENLPVLRAVICYSLDEDALLEFQENLPYWKAQGNQHN